MLNLVRKRKMYFFYLIPYEHCYSVIHSSFNSVICSTFLLRQQIFVKIFFATWRICHSTASSIADISSDIQIGGIQCFSYHYCPSVVLNWPLLKCHKCPLSILFKSIWEFVIAMENPKVIEFASRLLYLSFSEISTQEFHSILF